MRWKGRKVSENIEDKRGASGNAGGMLKGGLGGLPIPKGKTGLILIGVILVIGWISGKNPLEMLMSEGGNALSTTEESYQPSEEEEELANFVGVVLSDTEEVWQKLFTENGDQYKEPRLVLFTKSVQSACGSADAAMGPFYCSGDDRIYIDLSFYDDLKNKLNAPGDFAMAYVIAHEVGHHVQHLMGISDKIHEKRSSLSQTEYNKLSVKLELQADFFAGVWAHHAQKMNDVLQDGDIDEALNAANAIGDDRLQKQGQGYVVPDSFTHGTSEQRVRWFKKGFKTGDIGQGNTFTTPNL